MAVDREPDGHTTFVAGAVGDADAYYCEVVEVVPADVGAVKEATVTRCYSVSGGKLSESGWDALLAFAVLLSQKVGAMLP